MANGGIPSTCNGQENGNYQHQPWTCVNNVPMFYTTGIINTDGSYTPIPEAQQMPGAVSPRVPGSTIVQNGTLWAFSSEVGYVDTGKPATPLVVIGSDGKLISPGYNPGTGGWMVAGPDGTAIYGVAPTNAQQVPGAYDQALTSLESLGALLKSGQPGGGGR